MAIKDLLNKVIDVEDETQELDLDEVNTSLDKHIVKIYEPVSKSETSQIIDALKRGEMCCVNLVKVDDEDAKLIYSSLSGSAHALNATLKFIDTRTIICAPTNFLVDEEN